MLAPLTILTSIKSKFKWTQVEQDSFDEIKQVVDHDTLLTYPDFNETFKIHTDASVFQLGAVISQKVKHLASCSREVTDVQQWYTVTERELLSIVKTLKEYRYIFNWSEVKNLY